MTKKQVFYEQTGRLFSALQGSDTQSLVLFQSKEFTIQNPNSPTSALFRYFLGEEARGALLAFFPNLRKVDIAIISNQLYELTKELAGEQQGIKVSVYRIQKQASSSTPSGLQEVYDDFINNQIKQISLFSSEKEYLIQTKLMQQFYQFLEQNSIHVSDFDQSTLSALLKVLHDVHVQAFIDASKQSLKIISLIDQSLSKQNYSGQSVRMHSIARQVDCQELKETEKTSLQELYSQDRDKLSDYKYFQISINNTDYADLQKQILTQKLCNVSLVRGSAQGQVTHFTVSAQFQNSCFGGVSRSIFVVKDFQSKQIIQMAMDDFCLTHETSINYLRQGVPIGKAVGQISEFKRDKSFQRETYAINFADYHEMNYVQFAGYTNNGVGCKKDYQKVNNIMNLRADDQTPLCPNNCLALRTTGEISFNGMKFLVTIQDMTMPITEANTRSITSPYYTKNSAYHILRNYYLVIDQEVRVVSPEVQNAELEKDDFEEKLIARSDKKKLKQEMGEKLELLKQRVRDNQLRRMPTQQLLCDMQQHSEMIKAFDNVEQYARNIDFTNNGIILGDPMFFIINGKPVPIQPQYVHQVAQLDGGENRQQVKIKLIAPGNIQGKKEQHPQLIQYNDATYLKELILETESQSLANKICKELQNYKKRGEQIIQKQSHDNVVGLAVDPDNVMPAAVKQLINQGTSMAEVSLKSNYTPIDYRALNAALVMRPKFKLNKQQGKRDQGELFICEAGFHYKYIPMGGSSISCFIHYRNIRTIYFEKFTEKSHVLTISLQLYNPIRLTDIVVDKKDRQQIQQNRQLHQYITFNVSMETDTRLGAMGDRDEVKIENEKRGDMKRANVAFERFFRNLAQQLDEHFGQRLPDGAWRRYFCQVATHTRELRFSASAETQGLQTVYSYNNGALGCFNKKISVALNFADVELVVFENVNYSSRNAFQMAFIYKDVRVETFVLKQIRFDDLADIQLYLVQKDVFYTETIDSESWNIMRNNLNADRDVFETFVERGGWLGLYGLVDGSQQSESSVYAENSSDAAYTASSDEYEDDDDQDSTGQSVQSESGYDYESDEDETFDWDASES